MSAPRTAKPKHAGGGLPSFVWDFPQGIGKRRKRCWWHVRPPGNYAPGNFTPDDYTADNRLGYELALEYLRYEQRSDCGTFLQVIVNQMPRPLSGIEIGFLIVVATAASRHGLISAERAVASCWQQVV
jgi:hypothetical protein